MRSVKKLNCFRRDSLRSRVVLSLVVDCQAMCEVAQLGWEGRLVCLDLISKDIFILNTKYYLLTERKYESFLGSLYVMNE